MPSLVLGSSSRYRAELLARLQIPFITCKPQVNERPRESETPLQLAQRLAREKCLAVARDYPDAVVIGCDQVADRQGEIVSKAESYDNAVMDLQKSSGQLLIFHSAVCVRWRDRLIEFVDHTRCQFRTLSRHEIERYLQLEPAWDCAGSIKTEGLGLLLLESMETNDPTGVIGLPLIALARTLRELGLNC
jgi:septum formation protein